jgi:hypothetical protein
MRTNKTDRSDAKGLAELIRMGQSMLRVDWMTGTLRELWNLSGESRLWNTFGGTTPNLQAASRVDWLSDPPKSRLAQLATNA